MSRLKSLRILAAMLDEREFVDELAEREDRALIVTIFRVVKEWLTATYIIEAPPSWTVSASMLGEIEAMSLSWVPVEINQMLEALASCATGFDGRECIVGFCDRLSNFLQDEGLDFAGLAFAVLAGLCAQGDAMQAMKVGRFARHLARWEMAEAWFDHAIALGKHEKLKHVVAVGMNSIGNVYFYKGDYREAVVRHTAALNFVRRHKIKEVEGFILHDLSAVAVCAGDFERAEKYAKAALSAYGPQHRNVPKLAHDAVLVWLDQGHYEYAASVLNCLVRRLLRPSERLIALAHLAVALAGQRQKEAFLLIWEESWLLMENLSSNHYMLPTAIARLAEGAVLISDWERACIAAERALRVSSERREMDMIAKSESLLLHAKDRKSLADARVGPGSKCKHSSKEFADQLIRSLVVQNVVDSLERVPGSSHIQASNVERDALQRITIPHCSAQGPHSTFACIHGVAWMNEYRTFHPNLDAGRSIEWTQTLHFHLDGNPSFNRATRTDVLPPHVHDSSVPGGVRAALPHEIPARPW